MERLTAHEAGSDTRAKTRALQLSLSANGVAAVAKLVLALVTGSTAVLAEVGHSASDLLASLIALIAVRKAAAPADRSHPFGHERYENVSGVAEGAVILLVSGFVIATSILSFGRRPDHSALGVVTMLASASLIALAAYHVARVARDTRSPALGAEAAHLRTDVWTSLGVAVALGLVALTGVAAFDQLVAIGIALFTAAIGIRLIARGVRVLVDEAVPVEEVDIIRDVLARADPAVVRGYHRLRARRSGPVRHIDLHLMVDSDTSVGRAHQITDGIEAEIEHRLPDADVVIHVEPDDHRPERDSTLL